MTQAAGHAVPDDRGTHRLADDQSESRATEPDPDLWITRVREIHQSMDDEIPLSGAPPAPYRSGEIGTLVQPIPLRKHPGTRTSSKPPNRQGYRRRGSQGSADRASGTDFGR